MTVHKKLFATGVMDTTLAFLSRSETAVLGLYRTFSRGSTPYDFQEVGTVWVGRVKRFLFGTVFC